MTPGANDLCVFAVKRGIIEKRIDINYYLPKYVELLEKLRLKYGDNLTTIGQIADVVCGPFGSAIKNSDYQEEGIPLIRITNISRDGHMNYDDIVYIPEVLGDSLSRTQVKAGDIVVSQRGSLGQCAVVDDKFEKYNISANIIAIKNIHGLSAAFIHDYVLSSVGQTLLERSTSGQVQQKITTQDIAEMPIPICRNEERLASIMAESYSKGIDKKEMVLQLLRQTKEYVLNESGIEFFCSEIERPSCIAIHLGDAYSNSTLGVEYYHPERLRAIHVIRGHEKIGAFCLEQIVVFCRDIVDSTNSTERYLGLAGVESNTGELSGIQETAAGQAFVYHEGDVLYGRLRPYLNKVLLAEQTGICSTEFHVMRVKDQDVILPAYLAAVMRTDVILAQTKHMMTGNTHPRISNEDVKNLCIPIPGIDVQRKIVNELENNRKRARRLMAEADIEWAEAKAQFERELLGES